MKIIINIIHIILLIVSMVFFIANIIPLYTPITWVTIPYCVLVLMKTNKTKTERILNYVFGFNED